MSKDAYQPCPCGSGKKIKFCCKDYAGEIDRIVKLIDADQRQAALELIERSLKKKPDLQCLHAYKLQLAIADPDREAAKNAIDAFLKVAPANPTALAAQAIRHAAEWDVPDNEPSSDETWRAAVASLQRSLSNRGKFVTVLMLSAISIVGRRLLGEGKDLAAAAHFHLAALFAANLERPANDILELMADPSVSLLVKNRFGLPDPPADATWSDEYNAARLKAANGAWADAASVLKGLAKTTLGEPLPRRALGMLRAYLGENAKAVELLRRVAAMDNVPVSDAVDSEALAQFMDEDQRPSIESLEVHCEIGDVDGVKEKLLSCQYAISLGDQLNHLADEDGIPPVAAFWIVDRPQPASNEEQTHENTPRELAIVHLFGKQTDRTARLEYVVESQNHDATKDILQEILGSEALNEAEIANTEIYPAEVTLSDETLALPPGTPITVRKSIEAKANLHALHHVWPAQPNPALDGKTPREVAQDDSYKVRLNAALMVLEAQQFSGLDRENFQRLREEIGLERKNDITCRPGTVKRIPLAELARVDCSGLAEGDLAAGFQYAVAHAAIEASTNFGREILNRPQTPIDVRIAVNVSLFRLASDPDVALAYLHAAQDLAKQAGNSPASLLIQELTLRAIRHESREFNEVYERLAKRHINEPGIREQLLNVMVRLGLVRPDGTPIEREPVAVGTAAAGSTGSAVWTPDSASQVGEEKSKLWVPGQD